MVSYWRKFGGDVEANWKRWGGLLDDIGWLIGGDEVLLEEMWRIIGGDGVVYLRRWGGVLEEIW